jgi:hypothetical protein
MHAATMPRKLLRPVREIVAELGDHATPAMLPRGYGPAVIEAAVVAGEIRYRPDGTLEPVPRTGRPPRSGEAATRRIDLRATPAEERLWREAAESAGVGMRRFVADAATAAARKVSGNA